MVVKVIVTVLTLSVLLVIIYLYIENIDSFLCVHNPVETDLLIVEGWVPDYALTSALKEFRNNNYRYLITTGGRPYHGALETGFKSEANSAKMKLLQMKIGKDSVYAVPTRLSLTNRSFVAAKDLRIWLLNKGFTQKNINVLTVGPHGRRTMLLYTKAFGKDYNIGIVNVKQQETINSNWYSSFHGIKTMLQESFAWIYTKLFFHPRRVPQ